MSVTVIIPFYNAQKYIGEAIESCLIQKEVSQIILVNDGSNDQSYSIAKIFALKNKSISILSHPRNQGRAMARNTGLLEVTTPFFSFLDADDYYLDSRFENSLIALQNDPSIDGIYESVKSLYETSHTSGTINETTMINEKINPDHLFEYLVLGKGYFSLIGCTFRSSVINENLLFDPFFEIGEDTDWIWRLASEKTLKSLHNIPKVIRRVHSQNSYSNRKIVNKWKYKFYKKWNQRVEEYRLNESMKTKLKKSYRHFTLKYFLPFY